MTEITILGAGAWGTTFGQVLADAGNHITMWDKNENIVNDIRTQHHNHTRVPQITTLPANITAESDPQQAVRNADIIVVAIASQAARHVLTQFKPYIADTTLIVSLMKGIEQTTGQRIDEMIYDVLHLPAHRLAVVSGPNLSAQVAQREPTAAIIASANTETAQYIADISTTPYFKPTISTDIIGTELCGAIKNIIALAVGMSHGAGYGENTASVIMTYGLSEMVRLGESLGAMPETFYSVAGIGDLICTCSSPLSRNYTFGFNLGKGMTIDEATEASNGVAEGVATTEAILVLAERKQVKMPLVTAVHHILHGDYGFTTLFEEITGKEVIENE